MFKIDKNWALFLDRDGVINERIPGDYVKRPEEFVFAPQSLEAVVQLSAHFEHIFIVTNQAGIGKGVMTEGDLAIVHEKMLNEIIKAGGRIDKIYFAPEIAHPLNHLRKPNIGMALRAKEDFPGINLAQAIMVGDSISDIEFGKRAGMKTVFIGGKGEDPSVVEPDFQFKNLIEFTQFILGQK